MSGIAAGAVSSSAYAVSSQPAREPSIEVGVYRDGENNLDAAERITIPQMLKVTAEDPRVHAHVEDSTALYTGEMRTYNYDMANGSMPAEPPSTVARDMSERSELAHFVAGTLDAAYLNGSKQTWLFLIDHGAGNAGGLFTQEPNGKVSHMSIDTLAGAIADARVLHARRFPQDAGRNVDGIVMHECFMGTIAFAQTLSAAGVRYLAAPNETTIAPGVPAHAFEGVSANPDDPKAMAKAVVDRVMDTRYLQHDDQGRTLFYQPSATFMMLDLDPRKIKELESAEIDFNRTLIDDVRRDSSLRRLLLSDAARVEGMERDDPTARVPWHGDRPAITLYLTFAYDPRLPTDLRRSALRMAAATMAIVLAHRESRNAPGFWKNYTDAVGPTVPWPVTRDQIDPMLPAISETAASQNYRTGENAKTAVLLQPDREISA